MQLLEFILRLIIVHLILCCSVSVAYHGELKNYLNDQIAKTITVDNSGHGDFTSVQQAVDSIPQHNTLWTRIHVKAGIYSEKVKIPKEKPYIVLDGESKQSTVIQWGDAGNVIESSTFQLFAENFMARKITFKNTYNIIIPRDHENSNITWAPAALIQADKATFYQCGFVSLQDTLTDSAGRHYFESCYIQGAIDFIWGRGQSIYKKCTINVTAALLGGGPGFITAQGRNSTDETGGFVFIFCSVVGTGPAYLGRAYGKYSRVLFYKSYLSDIIVAEGWSSWHYGGRENSIIYSEVGCTGPGANKSKRVKWLKNLSFAELLSLIEIATFVNGGGWMDKQPKLPTVFL